MRIGRLHVESTGDSRETLVYVVPDDGGERIMLPALNIVWSTKPLSYGLVTLTTAKATADIRGVWKNRELHVKSDGVFHNTYVYERGKEIYGYGVRWMLPSAATGAQAKVQFKPYSRFRLIKKLRHWWYSPRRRHKFLYKRPWVRA